MLLLQGVIEESTDLNGESEPYDSKTGGCQGYKNWTTFLEILILGYFYNISYSLSTYVLMLICLQFSTFMVRLKLLN